MTIVCNVPRNNLLAAVDPTAADAARVWRGYLIGGTAWNHDRTVTALAAAAALTFTLLN